jgi:hypothetical protein
LVAEGKKKKKRGGGVQAVASLSGFQRRTFFWSRGITSFLGERGGRTVVKE